MPPIRVNLAGVATDEFSPVPEGRYRVTIFGVQGKKSKDKEENGKKVGGNPYLQWEFKIQEPAEFANKRLWLNTSLQEKALFGLKRLLLAVGVEAEELNNPEGVEIEPTDYLGSELVVQVKHREYNNQVQMDVARMYPKDTEVGLASDLQFQSAELPSSAI